MKKLHFINSLVLILLISWFIICCIILTLNIWEWAKIGVWYLWGLFLFFSLFWIFMKWWQFTLQTEKIKND